MMVFASKVESKSPPNKADRMIRVRLTNIGGSYERQRDAQKAVRNRKKFAGVGDRREMIIAGRCNDGQRV